MNLLFACLIGLFGASIGSFLSVAIHRIQHNKPGIITGTSQCPKCKKKLGPLDLIPIVSYLLLQGKCRQCKKPIPITYFLLELTTGLAFFALFLTFPLERFIFLAIYTAFLIGIFFYDLQTKEIPDLFLFPPIGIAIIDILFVRPETITSAIIASILALVLFGGQIAISKGKWLGTGDLYIAIFMALMFGWKMFIVATVLTYIIGALISIPLLTSKKLKMKSQVPFGPFLVLGSMITIFLGETILNWYTSTLLF